ncbi:MAG: DUF1802 family protein [Gemmatimonadaceae bacterium]
MTAADTERSALKEWSVLCDAMSAGAIVALVRKGGIREQRAGFVVRHDRFLLYPTYFHEKVAELALRFHGALERTLAARPSADAVVVQHVAQVASVWRVTELARMPSIAGEHGLTDAAVASRFNYRNRPEVYVVAVRVASLPTPMSLPALRRYHGCVSWVELEDDVPVGDARPVLSDGDFATRLQRLQRALGPPEPAP